MNYEVIKYNGIKCVSEDVYDSSVNIGTVIVDWSIHLVNPGHINKEIELVREFLASNSKSDVAL